MAPDTTATDDLKRREVAAQLRSGARAYASAAAEELLETRPDIGVNHGGGAFYMWQGFLSQRITELATAVELDEAALFTTELNWLYSTLATRKVSEDDVRAALGCLERSLESELSGAAWALVGPIVSGAGDVREGSGFDPDSRLDETHADLELSRAFLKKTLGGDAAGATGLILGAFADGVEAEVLYERVMLPVQAEIGTLWQRGELGIADEHVATELIRASMTALWLRATGGKVAGPAVVVGSVTGDQHDSGVRAASHLMDISGLRGICLGCDVPPEEFAVAAARFEAVGAVVSASMSMQLPRVRQTVDTLRSALPELKIVVGGPAFGIDDDVAGRLAKKLSAHGYARTPKAAAALLG